MKRMKIRIDEDYYRWNCEWCDSENRVLWMRVNEGLTCGACHRAMHLGGEMLAAQELKITAGLY